VQDKFLMGRPEGFNYFDPGAVSMVVPYHDISDFYFSGHIGTLWGFFLELRYTGYKKMAITVLVVAFC